MSFKYVEAKLFNPLNVFFGSTDIIFMPFRYLLIFIFGGILIGTLGGLFASGKTFKLEKQIYACRLLIIMHLRGKNVIL